MRNLWCLEKILILPLIISATGIVPQSLFKNLKILDLENTLVVEIQKGILLYSCHIVRKFLNMCSIKLNFSQFLIFPLNKPFSHYFYYTAQKSKTVLVST
jgi:hypothetical protein